MTRVRRTVVALAALQAVVVILVSCGVPTGESSFEAIDGDVLGGLNDSTSTSTTTTTTTTLPPTTTTIDVADSIVESTTTVTTTEPPPPATPVAIYFISRGRLSPITRELDPRFTFDNLIVALEEGPPAGSVGSSLVSYVEPGLIIGTPTTEDGVINIELDDDTFNLIPRRNQRQAFAQIVLTFLNNTTAVGQVAFTIDGEELLVLADGGSQSTLSVDDFASLNPAVPSSATEPQDVPTATTTTTEP